MPHPALPPLPDDAERALAASRRRVRVAAVQMVSTPRVAENLAVAEKWIAKAAAQGAQIDGLRLLDDWNFAPHLDALTEQT